MFEPADLTLAGARPSHWLPDELWLPILEHACDFTPQIFEDVAINLIKNPNINSSLLFRADILYDSCGQELSETHYSTLPGPCEVKTVLRRYGIHRDDQLVLGGFKVERTFIRSMVPRNPQLDKPISQTCHILRSTNCQEHVKTIVIYIPHVTTVDNLPWYHPRVQSLAYLHTWQSATDDPSLRPPSSSGATPHRGTISLHYRLFPSELLPLAQRLLRTAHNLLSTVYRHGQGQLEGYTKRVHHDQLISQQRVQNTYTELKRTHAKRLCDNWVEKTEPSKHVFEDLSIAAFLIELWKDMYSDPNDSAAGSDDGQISTKFPGFVDIGCGNGVLVDILLREGYPGWGFDAHKRKTWSTFSPWIAENLKQLILVPQPLFEMQSSSNPANSSFLSRLKLIPTLINNHNKPNAPVWHNGLFPTGTFIISNHADELTPWTPLLASLSSSPFLAIPCCSHNLSGAKFRAPSLFNSNQADYLAPTYFAANITKSKSIALTVACSETDDQQPRPRHQPETGNLKDLSVRARAKQPSAYSSLCDWVCHLTSSVGYEVEKEMLRLPSTRNMGIIGRRMGPGAVGQSGEERMERVKGIARREGADGKVWVERAKGGRENEVHLG
ncbi:tRNA (uracil-O(2)-)-methyltransferase [Physcia stellaris]|nr:tRNA (uracil-O(2)-)-methyltransferase [Physcia stellaris]